jgi:hypothetical protein
MEQTQSLGWRSRTGNRSETRVYQVWLRAYQVGGPVVVDQEGERPGSEGTSSPARDADQVESMGGSWEPPPTGNDFEI